jgi:hypothetical protein
MPNTWYSKKNKYNPKNEVNRTTSIYIEEISTMEGFYSVIYDFEISGIAYLHGNICFNNNTSAYDGILTFDGECLTTASIVP